MSIHLYSFSDLPLASIGEWQKFIDAADFPLWLSTEHELDKNGGSLVAQLHGKQISFEYRFENAKELMDLYNDINFGHDWKYLLVLPWIHGFDGLDAAWMAATSYAHATAGIVFDPQEGKVFNSEEALQVVHDMDGTKAEAEAAAQQIIRRISTKS